jgi:hypothetical protein
VIALPPFDAGRSQAIVAVVPATSIERRLVGALGGPARVVNEPVTAAPVPALLTAETLTRYVEAGASPDRERLVLLDTLLDTVLQVSPLSLEVSTW